MEKKVRNSKSFVRKIHNFVKTALFDVIFNCKKKLIFFFFIVYFFNAF